ncbi:PREDICTED: B3 domain-containing protein Os04g0386900-like [Ipomoea nil]|uniref:B3 domain-containing protein Os04g0386900-like n=1 Tax=Ipomoea nil TaxID=35883 RepID=UPI0009017D94|nr:PREDICTED: B3 domain-containing protein Os04g0386900-like [Ipomoea nil]XP_019168272.1 PREDICTED: B3 domain-containing protein Os04g0386900-like [Ipomoea nil]
MSRPQKNNTPKTPLAKSDSDSDSDCATPKFNDEPIEPLSGMPFYDFVLSKEKRMMFPAKMNSVLPNGTVPAVITYGKRTWSTTLHGEKKRKGLDYKTWKKFLNRNKLRFGDGLILEVMQSSQELVKFKAQILRADFPAQLEPKITGGTPQTPILIDID